MSVQAKTAKQVRLEKRNEKIRERFSFLTGRKHLSLEHSLLMLEEEFMPLASDTIWLIVSKTGFYKNK